MWIAVYWALVLYRVSQLALVICGICFAGGGAFAIVNKDNPDKTTMKPGTAYLLIGVGAIVFFGAIFIWPKFADPRS